MLDLADPLARDVERPADLVERARLLAVQPVTKLEHAPLALRHHPGMWEYRQLVVRATHTPGSPDFDGLAVLGFPTPEDLRDRLYDSPAGQKIIEEDIARFIDLARSEATFTGEYVLKS